MGHVVFVALHAGAVLFAPILLVVTVPVHLVYAAVAGRRRDPEAPKPSTHVRCPDCRELVRKDANRCKHCGCTLVPQ